MHRRAVARSTRTRASSTQGSGVGCRETGVFSLGPLASDFGPTITEAAALVVRTNALQMSVGRRGENARGRAAAPIVPGAADPKSNSAATAAASSPCLATLEVIFLSLLRLFFVVKIKKSLLHFVVYLLQYCFLSLAGVAT